MKNKIYSLFTLLCVVAAQSNYAQVVINEISYNSITPNSPGKLGGVEYLELYNDGNSAVNLLGWTIPRTANNGIRYTFGNLTINPGQYLVLTNDSVGFENAYNFAAYEYEGFILNNGYRLELRDTAGNKEDSVRYDDAAPWPVLADGQGCSIELCDVTSDNADAANWSRATNYLGTYNRRKTYGTPGKMNSMCSNTPIVQVQFRTASADEADGRLTFDIYIDNVNGSNSSVEVHAVNGSGDAATDITFRSPALVTFNGQRNESRPFTFTIEDDTLEEPEENIYFILKNPSNANLANDTLELTINVDPLDVIVKRQIKLNGILNLGGNPPAPNLVEIVALADISDISDYSLGCANNGGGTDGIEFQFPAVSVKKGKSYFITRQPAEFKRFFGFDADFLDTAAGRGTTTATNFTGDDAMELFERGKVIDRYGLPNVDGTGEVWEYENSWGKRKSGTGPDGDNFVVTNWIYGGFNALDDTLANDSCSNPYPLPKREDPKEEEDTTSVIDISESGTLYSLYPNPATSSIQILGIADDVSVVVVDMVGNVVDKMELKPEEKLDVSSLNTGVYFMQISNQNWPPTTIRFVKQ